MLKQFACVVGCILLASSALAQTESAEDYLHPQLNHDEIGYVPQQQSPTDYTNGAVRLGDIPGQDLVRPFGGSTGLALGNLKPSKPANTTKNAVDAALPHLLTTRQSAALDRDSRTGLPLDVATGKSQGMSDYLSTPEERAKAEADALSAATPR